MVVLDKVYTRTGGDGTLGLAPESSEIYRRSAKATRDVRRQSYLTRSDQML